MEWNYRVRHNAKCPTYDYQEGCYTKEVAEEVFDGIVEELSGRTKEPFTVTLEKVDRDYMGIIYVEKVIKSETRNN